MKKPTVFLGPKVIARVLGSEVHDVPEMLWAARSPARAEPPTALLEHSRRIELRCAPCGQPNGVHAIAWVGPDRGGKRMDGQPVQRRPFFPTRTFRISRSGSTKARTFGIST